MKIYSFDFVGFVTFGAIGSILLDVNGFTIDHLDKVGVIGVLLYGSYWFKKQAEQERTKVDSAKDAIITRLERITEQQSETIIDLQKKITELLIEINKK
jgi:hypothetical protein